MYPIGAVTRGSKGEQLADIAELHAAGCVAITDDGQPGGDGADDAARARVRAMFDLPVIDHCEDPSLKGDGVAHEGSAPRARAAGHSRARRRRSWSRATSRSRS